MGEIGGMVFGLTQIVWFAWLGIALLRKPAGAATAVDAYASGQGAAA
ncbi:MAG: hypothetical protein R2854_08405 [Caldilineaceae bacterium]